jgi:hypothetical protein
MTRHSSDQHDTFAVVICGLAMLSSAEKHHSLAGFMLAHSSFSCNSEVDARADHADEYLARWSPWD